MPFVNFNQSTVTFSIAYVGPPGSGKRCNFSQLVKSKRAKKKESQRLCVDASTDIKSRLGDMTVCIEVFAVDLLADTQFDTHNIDGWVFVADLKVDKIGENRAAFKTFISHMESSNCNLEELPLVFQYNKKDLDDATAVEIMQHAFNQHNHHFFMAAALLGEHVDDTLNSILAAVEGKYLHKFDSMAAQSPLLTKQSEEKLKLARTSHKGMPMSFTSIPETLPPYSMHQKTNSTIPATKNVANGANLENQLTLIKNMLESLSQTQASQDSMAALQKELILTKERLFAVEHQVSENGTLFRQLISENKNRPLQKRKPALIDDFLTSYIKDMKKQKQSTIPPPALKPETDFEM